MSSNQSDKAGLPQSLYDRASSSWSRFKQTGSREDIDLTISIGQSLLESHPTGQPNRGQLLHNLAISYATQYDRWRDVEDLERAITLRRESL